MTNAPKMKISDLISYILLRLERGSGYWKYINFIVTAILIALFTSEINFWYKVVSAIGSFVVIYLLGELDIRFGVFRKYQKLTGDQHPTFVDMHKKLDKIIKSIESHENDTI